MTGSLLPQPKQLFQTDAWAPGVGYKINTYEPGTLTRKNTYSDYALTTPNANPVIANARGEAVMYGTGLYRIIVTDASDATVWDADNVPVTGATAEALRTELAASPGSLLVSFLQSGAGAASRTMQAKERDIVSVKDFGVAGDASDEATNLQKAITAAGVALAMLWFPASASGYKTGTELAVTQPVELVGNTRAGSFIFTSSDITILSFTNAASDSVIRNLQILGPGAGSSTKPGVLFTNAHDTQIYSSYIRNFDVGVRYAPGAVSPQSCYCCSIHDSLIVSNGSINIDAQANTNELQLYNTQFGGNSEIGLKVVDSNSLAVYGGGCEGVSVCAVDLDATSALPCGHLISGVHFENNTSSAGDIRIGNTATVRGVAIIGGNLFKPGTGADCAISAVRCDGLAIIGNILHSGYTSGLFLRKGTIDNLAMLANGGSATVPNEIYQNFSSPDNLTWDAATTYHASYAGGAAYNYYKINSGSMTAAKNYFGGLDIARIVSSTAPGAGSKVYARACIASNGYGDSFEGAIYAEGDIDMGAGAISLFQSASAPAVASSGTITTTKTGLSRVAPAAAVTGVILQAGVRGGQECTVLNESAAASSITFAAAATSHVVTGTSEVIAGQTARKFVWNSVTEFWYPVK